MSGPKKQAAGVADAKFFAPECAGLNGGQSWEPMIVAMDMGNDPKHSYAGVGDPSILVDPKNGRVWIAALWSHGKRGWNGSGPGMTPEETGQFMLAYSDDDGKTWSKPR